jgi:hypothetical protein
MAMVLRDYPERPTLLFVRPLDSQAAKPMSTASRAVCTRLKAAVFPVLPRRLLELAVNLEKRGGQRFHRVGHEARDEGECENPDRAVKPARQADPGPEIGDADDQSRDRHR